MTREQMLDRAVRELAPAMLRGMYWSGTDDEMRITPERLSNCAEMWPGAVAHIRNRFTQIAAIERLKEKAL